MKTEPSTSLTEKPEPSTSEKEKTEPSTSLTEKPEPSTSENEKRETTTTGHKGTEYSLYSSTIPETKEKKNSIKESTGNIPTSTTPTKETQENSDQKTNTPTEHQEEHKTNTEYTLTSSYGDNKEKIETTIVKQNPVLTTSFTDQKNSIIGTTIPNYINLTSITSVDNNIPTTIIEGKIQTTIITDYGSAYVILVGFSLFSKYNTYCTFYIHFVSIRGYIFSYSLTINVEFIYNRSLRYLQSHEATCQKADDNLESAAYLCNINTDVSNVGAIKIAKEFNFESQEINVVGISPVAQTLMENIKEAEGEYDNLLKSTIYVLDNSTINTNNKNKTFNINGIINEPKPTFDKINLTLIINVENDKNKIQVESNCTIIDINGSNYTLNCQGKRNILYNLQNAVSFINNDLLVINFEQNATSEIIFTSNSIIYKRKDSKSLSAGAIVAIVLVPIIVLVSLIGFILFTKRNKTQINLGDESTMTKLKK